MNTTAILSLGQAFGYKPQKEGLYVAHDFMPVAKPIIVVSAIKLDRGLTADCLLGLHLSNNGIAESYRSCYS